MEQENSSYFQEVRNNFSISVFINLIKLYFLGATQEDVDELKSHLFLVHFSVCFSFKYE